MTWDVYRDREWEPHEAELAVQADQMRKVEARVTDFAPAHGLQRITLALTGARLGTWAPHAARRCSATSNSATTGSSPKELRACRTSWSTSSRTSSATTPPGTSCRRRQSRRAASSAPDCSPSRTSPVLVDGAFLRHDRGPPLRARAALRALTHFLHDRRALPVPLRLIAMVVALRSHPPLLLRRWGVRHVPDLPGSTRTRRPRPAVLATDQFHARSSGSHPVSANVASCTREGVGRRNSFR